MGHRHEAAPLFPTTQAPWRASSGRPSPNKVSSNAAESVRVLYGGSVNAANIKDFMAKSDVDGALVGGASSRSDNFTAIVRYWV